MRRGCRERFPRLQRKSLVSNPRMHYGACVTHVPWCMSGSLTRDGRKKRSRHSRCMHNPPFFVSGKRPMHWQEWKVKILRCLEVNKQHQCVTDALTDERTDYVRPEGQAYSARTVMWISEKRILEFCNRHRFFNSSPIVPHICFSESGQHWFK